MSSQKQPASPPPTAIDKPRKHPRGTDGKFYGYPRPRPKPEPGQKQEG